MIGLFMHKAELPVIDHACQVMGIIPLTKDTFQVELKSFTSTTLNYHAGQYLKLELDVNGDGFIPCHILLPIALIQNNLTVCNFLFKTVVN